ncbi:MAG: hypothetical protein ABEK84_08515 [Salinibacter sp.]
MEEVLVPLGFFALVAYIAKLIRDTRVRRKALESSLSEEAAEAFARGGSYEPSTKSALKWGLVVLALGAGLLFVDLLTISFESPLAYAVLLLATGIALLGYYLVEEDEDTPENSPFSPADAPAEESMGEPER